MLGRGGTALQGRVSSDSTLYGAKAALVGLTVGTEGHFRAVPLMLTCMADRTVPLDGAKEHVQTVLL